MSIVKNRAASLGIETARNRKDFEDIPEQARQQLEFVWIERVEEAVSSALGSATASSDQSPEKPVRRIAAAEA